MHYYVAVVLNGEKLHASDSLIKALAPFQEYDGRKDFDRRFLVFSLVDCTEEEAKEEGYEKDPATGQYGYWHNPNSRWDWWRIQGDYGVGENGVARPEDFEAEDEEARGEAEDYWHGYVEGKSPEKYGRQLFNARYFLNALGPKEVYAYVRSHKVPAAFVDENGEWHEGHWGGFYPTAENSVYLEEWKAMIKRLKGTDAVLVMVNCHI